MKFCKFCGKPKFGASKCILCGVTDLSQVGTEEAQLSAIAAAATCETAVDDSLQVAPDATGVGELLETPMQAASAAVSLPAVDDSLQVAPDATGVGELLGTPMQAASAAVSLPAVDEKWGRQGFGCSISAFIFSIFALVFYVIATGSKSMELASVVVFSGFFGMLAVLLSVIGVSFCLKFCVDAQAQKDFKKWVADRKNWFLDAGVVLGVIAFIIALVICITSINFTIL